MMPSRKGVSSKSCLMNSRAPEITPVSYPKSNPPVAVIAAAMFTNLPPLGASCASTSRRHTLSFPLGPRATMMHPPAPTP